MPHLFLPQDILYFGGSRLLTPPEEPVDFGISSVNVIVNSSTSISVEWRLFAGGTGQIEYDIDSGAPYANTSALETSYLTYHFQTINGLTPGKTYYIRVHSVSQTGEHAYSSEFSATTEGSAVTTAGPRPAPATPVGPSVKVIGIDTVAVDDSGNTDVTSTLQSILNNLNAGDTLVFSQSDPQGHQWGSASPISKYRISNYLSLPHVNNVTLWGYGTQIRQYGTASTLALRSSNIDNLKIAGFELMGMLGSYARTTSIYSAPGGEGNHGIGLERPAHGWIIEDCFIHHMVGDGIYHAAWPNYDWRGVGPFTVRYCRIEDCKRQSIAPNCGFWNISYNELHHVGMFHIDLEDGKRTDFGLPASSGTYENNVFGVYGWASLGGVGAIRQAINFTWAWNDTDGPPNRSPCGPYIIRNNRVVDLLPPVFRGDYPVALVGRSVRSSAYSSTWSDYTRINNKDSRGYALTVENNTFDLDPEEQVSSNYVVRMRSADGVLVSGNVKQGLTIDVPTSGYGANTSVTVTGNT